MLAIEFYGVYGDIITMSKYEDYNWTKSKAIFDMLNMLQVAIKDNRPIITNRAKFMHIAIWLTLVFIIFFDKIR